MVKSKFIIPLAIASVFVFSGCNKNTPKDVAQQWLTDFYHLNYEDAKKLSTEETKTLLNTIEAFSSCLADSIKQNAKKVTIKIKEVKEENDHASVTFIASTDPNHVEPPVKLVKQNDKWLVLFTKSDFKPSDSMENGIPMNPEISITQGQPVAPTPDSNMTPDTAHQLHPENAPAQDKN